MSHPIPATLYRIAAVAGGGSAVILLINAAKRAEVIPTSALTQLVAPLGRRWWDAIADPPGPVWITLPTHQDLCG